MSPKKKESIFSLINIFKLACLKKKFIKFVFVGFVNTIFGYSIFSFGIFIGLHYSISLLLSSILGIIFNFNSIGLLVFKDNNKELFFNFLFIYLIIYIVNLLFIKLIFFIFPNYYVSAAIMLVPSALLSFLLLKTYVFNKKKY